MIAEIIVPGFPPITIDVESETRKLKEAGAPGNSPIQKYFILDPASKEMFEMPEDPRHFIGKEQRFLSIRIKPGKLPVVNTTLGPGLAR